MKKIELQESIPPQAIFHKEGKWLVTEKVRYCIELKSQWVIVEIPKGFSADLNTVTYDFPLISRWINHRTVAAAIFHHALYREGYDRRVADNAFLRAMKLEGVKIYYRYPLYWSARLFGGFKYLAVLKHNLA